MPASSRRNSSIEKGTEYLAKMVRDDGTIASPPLGFVYPVYTAANAVVVLARSTHSNREKALTAWLKELRSRQLIEPLGWRPDDRFYGGWGYSKDLPTKPVDGQLLGPPAEPNLSATVFALEALRSAGLPSDDPAVQKALRFVRRCQNFAADRQMFDDRFDDGGFFFIQGDPIRDKAGPAGSDRNGRQRFASYGSSTADGLRALLLCGLPADDARIRAAPLAGPAFYCKRASGSFSGKPRGYAPGFVLLLLSVAGKGLKRRRND